MPEALDDYAEYGPFGLEVLAEEKRLIETMTPSRAAEIEQRHQEIARRRALQRKSGTRPKPSDSLISRGDQPAPEVRNLIVDLAAELAESHGAMGRNDQCVTFACYVRAMLTELGMPARVAVGKATYETNGVSHEMLHAWVETDAEVVDGNADSFDENLTIPDDIRPAPYWGPKGEAPHRTFKEFRELRVAREGVEVDQRFPSAREKAVERFRQQLNQHGGEG